MKKFLLILMMAAFVSSLMVHKMFAATPGSACSLNIRSGFPLYINITDPGTVSPTGASCAPISNTLGLPLGTGVTCGTTIKILNVSVKASCPN